MLQYCAAPAGACEWGWPVAWPRLLPYDTTVSALLRLCVTKSASKVMAPCPKMVVMMLPP